MTYIKAWMSLNFGKIPLNTTELAALEHRKKSIYNVENTLAPLLSIKSSSFLPVRRTTIKSGQSSK